MASPVIHASPGHANVIAGQNRRLPPYGPTADKMTVRFPAGLLVNMGEEPKTSYPGKFPSTRMGVANPRSQSVSRGPNLRQKNDDRKRTSRHENMKHEGTPAVSG